MYASRTQTCRLIDYSAPLKFDGIAALRKQIVAYVRGVRGDRHRAVSEAQIVTWFRGTPAEFVKARLLETVASGEITVAGMNLGSHRRANGAYAYEARA